MALKQQGLINAVGNIVYLAAQWLLTVITTWWMGYKAVGLLTLAMTVGNVFAIIQMYGVRSFQSSDVTYRFSTGDYIMARRVTVLFGILICFLFVVVRHYTASYAFPIVLYTLYRTSESLSDVYFGEIQRCGRLELAGISILIRGVLTAACFGVCAFYTRNLSAALFSVVLSSFFITIFVDKRLYKNYARREKGCFAHCKEILQKCFPLFIGILFPSIITAFPRLVLEKHAGVELLGFYGNVSTPAVIITVLIPSILSALMPMYGELANNQEYNKILALWEKTVYGTVIFSAICIALAFFFAKPILAILYTDRIIQYTNYLYFFIISTMVYALTMCAASVLIAIRANIQVGLCALSAAVLSVIISFPLVSRYSIAGAIATLIISYLSQYILQVLFIYKFIKT